MKTTVNLSKFRDAFFKSSNYRNNFSYTGLSYLFGFLEDLENNTGEELELDVGAICCEYAEQDINDIIADHAIYTDNEFTDEQRKQAVLDFLEDNTVVCGMWDDNIIYMQF